MDPDLVSEQMNQSRLLEADAENFDAELAALLNGADEAAAVHPAARPLRRPPGLDPPPGLAAPPGLECSAVPSGVPTEVGSLSLDIV